LALHARSVHGAGPAPFTPPPDARYTLRGNRLYLHLLAWPFRHVHLPDMADKIEYAQLLNDASEIAMTAAVAGQHALNTTPGSQPPGTLTLTLPVRPPRVAVPVVELFLREG
jgi:alpha-L-fucosidase